MRIMADTGLMYVSSNPIIKGSSLAQDNVMLVSEGRRPKLNVPRSKSPGKLPHPGGNPKVHAMNFTGGDAPRDSLRAHTVNVTEGVVPGFSPGILAVNFTDGNVPGTRDEELGVDLGQKLLEKIPRLNRKEWKEVNAVEQYPMTAVGFIESSMTAARNALCRWVGQWVGGWVGEWVGVGASGGGMVRVREGLHEEE